MLIQVKLLINFWLKIVIIITYIINRTAIGLLIDDKRITLFEA